MLGSAPQVGFWILLEVRDTWEAKNLENNDLPEVAKIWLDETVTRCDERDLLPRVQFIRHRRRSSDPLTLMTWHDGELRSQLIDGYEDLKEIDVLDTRAPAKQEVAYFVCTHAKRDMCCSRLGIPVWQRLDELSNGRAWQTTHLGGHRFAPNVLVLPSAHSYGRVALDQVDDFFNQIEQGDIAWDLLRGNAALPPEVQVCECAIQAEDGQFVAMTSDEVHYSTPNGNKAMKRPEKSTMEVLASCDNEQLKEVDIYIP